MALANAPELTHAGKGGDLVVYRFQETRPLPSYLVAFAVGPFAFVDAGHGGRLGVPLRIVVPRGLADQAGFAASAVAPLLARLETYFGIPYPYPNLDFLAVPGFFGAMENPGLITYDQALLLSPASGATLAFRRELADTAAHEMAHQWFGDLVTMSWWDDTWLNEGFASWMGRKVVSQWQPEWGFAYDSAEDRNRVMKADALASARKIRQPIEAMGDITSAFDSITYDKGQAALSMFEAWMGPAGFQEGVRRYLAAHADGNATTAQFLAALAGQEHTEIPTAFSTFLDQAGLPAVAVSLRPGTGRMTIVTLSQKRYLPMGSAGDQDLRWQIPVTLRYSVHGSQGHTSLLLSERTGEVRLPEAMDALDYVLVNEGGVGYFRTCYQGDLAERLLRNQGLAMTVPERIKFIEDSVTGALSGDLPVARVLALVSKFQRDPDLHVQEALASLVAWVDPHFIPAAARPAYTRFVQATFGPEAKALGLVPAAGEDGQVSKHRERVVGLVAGKGEDPVLRAEARLLALAWLRDRKSLDGGAAPGVLNLAALGGDRELFDSLLREARATANLRDKGMLLVALGSFRQPDLAKEAMALVLETGFEPLQRFYLLGASAGTPAGCARIADLFEAHLDQIVACMPWYFGIYAPSLLKNLGDEQRLAELDACFRSRFDKVPGLARAWDQAKESIRLTAAAKVALQPGVAAFLKDR